MPTARRFAATLGLERTMLMSLALALSLAACQEPEQTTGPSLSQAALPNSITLTYICGNSFRVRNTNPTVMTVTWDVYQKGETGSLTLPAKPSTGPYSETYFTTVNKGTVRLFLDGVLIQTKANGNKPPCQLPVVRPPIPNNVDPPDDSLYVLLNPSNPENQIYRRLGQVSFLPSATDSMVVAFFNEFGATVVGGLSGLQAYFIQFPDPGPSLQALDSVLTRMRAFPGVELVAGVSRTLPPGRVEGRFPVDGPGFSRLEWAQPSPGTHTWALKAIRAPLAWGCETGTYSSGRVKVAVLEQAFYPNPDVVVSARVVADTQRTHDAVDQGLVDKWEWHGAAVAGALSASGDNGLGAVGAIWSSDLIIYEMTPPNRRESNAVLALEKKLVPDMIGRQPRILSISSEMELGASMLGERGYLRKSIRQLLDGVPGLLVVIASGDGGVPYTTTGAQNDTTSAIRAVLVELALSSSEYRDRILFVGGTSPGHTLYQDSDWIAGMTELVAPGENVGVVSLARGGSVYSTATLGNGTSFSAPLVAGVAAQLWSMSPFLLASQVKRLLIDGAKQPRLDPASGQLVAGSDRALSMPGTAEQVYELDAYGSLSLLSAGDDATPICGFPVVTSLVSHPTTGDLETSVRIARPGAPLEIYRGEVGSVTVAQGGRRIGIDGYTTSVDRLFQNGSWSGTGAVAFRGYRQFLERDTAFIDYSTGPELLTIRGATGPRGPFNVCEGFTGLFATACYSGPIASTGEWAHITVSRNNYDLTGCGPANGFYGSYLVPLGSSGSRIPLRETNFEPCAPEAGAWNLPGVSVLAWRSDGAVAWDGQSDVSYFVTPGVPDSLDPYPGIVITTTGVETTFKQVSVVSGLTVLGERTINNRLSYALGWRADGSTLISYEYEGLGWSNCQRTVRAGLAPELEVTDSAGPVPWCGNAVMEPLPASRLGAPLVSALRGKGTAAAPTGRPLSAAELRLRALQQRQVPRIVLVN
jgi:hypothetical protein